MGVGVGVGVDVGVSGYTVHVFSAVFAPQKKEYTYGPCPAREATAKIGCQNLVQCTFNLALHVASV